MGQRAKKGGSRKVAGVLDIGTSKVACLIAAVPEETRADHDERPAPRVLGVGHQRSRGVKAGVVTDLDQAEEAVRGAIAQAERMAGVLLEEVAVSVACGQLRSRNFTATADVESGVVAEDDVSRVLAAGRAYAERDGETLVYLNEVAVRLDGAPGGDDPRGMAARSLAADLHAVTVDEAPLRNLLLVVERCFLSASPLVPAPLASALGATTEEERRLGVTCIDIGGGTTAVAMFAEGRFLHASMLSTGGNHITLDIARALHTPLAEAERIKALYGTLVGAQSDGHDAFSYPATGGGNGDTRCSTKGELAEIVRPRVKGLMDLVRAEIANCEVGAYAGRSVVLTGGTSQLVGLAEFAAAELGCAVRVGSPQGVSGLPLVLSTPAFAAPAGLLVAGADGDGGVISLRDRRPAAGGYLGRVGAWLRRGF